MDFSYNLTKLPKNIIYLNDLEGFDLRGNENIIFTADQMKWMKNISNYCIHTF